MNTDRVHSTPGHPTDIDVLVVGGGLAGLTAATHAARGGASVAVLDTSTALGGRAGTTRRDGICFNQGPHALYERGEGMAVLQELGIDPPGGRPDGSGVGVLSDAVGPLPLGAGSLLTTKLLRPRARAGFARFHLGLARLDARSYDEISLADFLDRKVGPGRSDLRSMIEGFVRLASYADAPEELSAGAAIEQLKLAVEGVRYLHGGWGALVSSLEAAAVGASATTHAGTKVDRLEPVGGSWVAVDADDTRWTATSVVLAGLSPEAVERLGGVAAGTLRDAAGPAARVACLDLVLDTTPKVTFALDFDRHVYYSLHAPLADLATDGRALVSLALYRRPDGAADAARDRATMRAFARRMGVETTLDERYLHDMTVTHGMPLATGGGLSGRPAVDALARHGLLIAGDWVGPTGLLADAALASGRAAGRLAADRALRRQVA